MERELNPQGFYAHLVSTQAEYQIIASILQILVARSGIEPPTREFSVRCSTSELPHQKQKAPSQISLGRGFVYLHLMEVQLRRTPPSVITQ